MPSSSLSSARRYCKRACQGDGFRWARLRTSPSGDEKALRAGWRRSLPGANSCVLEIKREKSLVEQSKAGSVANATAITSGHGAAGRRSSKSSRRRRQIRSEERRVGKEG